MFRSGWVVLGIVGALAVGCCGVATAAPGDLDPSFGNGAGFVHPVSGGALTDPIANGVVLQPDGKIVIAGFTSTPIGNIPFVARLLDPSGARDPSFGSGTGIAQPSFGGSDNQFHAVALQPDGRIVAAGTTNTHGSSDLLAARLLTDGSLDTSYGLGTGASAPDFGGAESGSALALQPDGKIVVGGTGPDPGSTDRLLVARFLNPQGTLDTSYGAGFGASRPNAFPGAQTGTAVALQPDGKIVVAGTTRQTAMGPGDFIVARFVNPDGTADTGFGSANGGAVIDFGADESAKAMVLQPDGKILVAGTTTNGTASGDFAVTRLLSNGAPDNTFGNGGKAIIDLGGADSANAMALQADGKILLAGTTVTGSAQDMAVVRLQPDGTLDSAFGRGGKSTLDFGQNETANAIAIAPDGKILLAGFSNVVGAGGSAIVVRLLGDPAGTGGSGGGAGGGGGGGAGGGGAGGRPTLRQLTMTPRRFAAATTGASAARARPVGALVSYRLDIGASVRFSVQHTVAGRKQGHGRHTRCVAPSKSNRRAPGCRRIVTVGGFARSGSAGVNSFRFTGRVNNHKLAPGGYTLVAVPSANRKTGSSVSVSFQITR